MAALPSAAPSAPVAQIAGAGVVGTNAGAGGDAAGMAGHAAGSPAAGSGGTPPQPDTHTAAAGSAGPMPLHVDHCLDGYAPDPSDAQLTSVDPDEWMSPTGQVDLLMPKPVLAWMHKNKWMEAHDAWHNVRRCSSFLSFPNSPTVNICDEHPDLVAEDQECSGAADGFAFLVEHRHMLNGFKQAFPQHTELFAGFDKFPFDAKDVPVQWRDRFGTGWSAQIRQVARIFEDIENNLSMFPTEGDLGYYMQCGGMGQLGAASSIHTALHFKWTVADSPHALVDQVVDLGNYMFWKLHGWMDDVWERYRIAKALLPDEPKLRQALLDNCREMDRLSQLFDPSVGTTRPSSNGPATPEYGDFHTNVRPILNDLCSGCHSGTAPMGGVSFARNLQSREITSQLVDVASKSGGQFKRVVAGKPQESWFFLKVTDMAKASACTGICNLQSMPPTGQVELDAAQIEAIRSWIANGALAPTTSP